MSFYVSKTLSIDLSGSKSAEGDGLERHRNFEYSLSGGILGDTDHAWRAKTSSLEVINISNGNKIGTWKFGAVLKDQSAQIACVDKIERTQGKVPFLVAALNCTFGESTVCIFDAPSSKVIRAIKVPEKITSLHVVDSGCEILTMPGPLRSYDGILSIGTASGNVFLVDMCLQNCEEDISNIEAVKIRDESDPCCMMLLRFADLTKIEHLKTKSLKRREHLAIHLNVVLNKSTEHFVLKGQEGEDRLHVNKDEVTVSALHFCPQLASLLVGYNFGAFQVWDLMNLILVYTSPVSDDHIPVTHFAIQEPADDPRAFCYVWVAYSPECLYLKVFPYAVMYALCYSTKEHSDDYGLVYQGFQSSSVRFRLELNQIDRGQCTDKSRAEGGQCIQLHNVSRGSDDRECSSSGGSEDHLAFCLFAWTVWCNKSETHTYAAVFDLNQWYKEQMPKLPDWSDCSTYLIHVCISDLIPSADVGKFPLLDVHLPKASLGQFIGTQRLEEHFYPTALVFDLCCLSGYGVITVHSQGVQKTLLSQIESAGPLCLLKSADISKKIVDLGLTPLYVEMPYHISDISTEAQCYLILDLALEQQMLSWLCKCASEWANGSFISVGCSLDLLLNWAFQRLITLKSNCDRLCVPLFDHSEVHFDANTTRLLNCCFRQIKHLSHLYEFITTKLSKFLSDPEGVSEQCLVVQMLSLYYEVLQWMLNMGLLPECPANVCEPKPDRKGKIAVPYAAEKLTSYYLERRVMLKHLNKDRFSTDQSILFIDNLLNCEAGGDIVQREWQKDGGSGLYPPLSMQALLRSYLVEQMSVLHKHMVVTYLFLDLTMTLDNKTYDHIIPQLIKFPTIFKMSLSNVKLTQAFWELDHGGFISATEQLLDPLILTEDFRPWHHKVALRSFLLQDQPNLALMYLQVRKPPVVDEEDIMTTISLYVSNRMINEAFYLQKQCQKQNKEEKLLLHLFNECSHCNVIDSLVTRSMSQPEEEVLFRFLKTLSQDNLQITYLMMRSRYLEAFTKYEDVNKTRPSQMGLIGQRNASTVDYLMNSFKLLLPKVTSDLVDVCRKEKTTLWKQVDRPTPMSVFVHNPVERIRYKSTLMNAALAKAKHTFTDSTINASEQKKDLLSEETPFLRTPTAFPSQKRKAAKVITPKMISLEEDSCDSLSSAKKRKLTPALPRKDSVRAKLDTPIVKRKTSKGSPSVDTSSQFIFTPQSILKVRHLVRANEQVETSLDAVENSYCGEDNPQFNSTPISLNKSKSALNLSPRKALRRTSRPSVRFDESILNGTRKSDAYNSTSARRSLLDEHSPGGAKIIRHSMDDSKRTSTTSDETFYSPEDSFDDIQKETRNRMSRDVITPDKSVPCNHYHKKETGLDSEDGFKTSSILKSRRSYKGTSIPLRSSARIAKATLNSDASKIENVLEEKKSELSEPVVSSPKPKRLQGRRPLSRQVLEANAFNRLLSSSASDVHLPKGRPSSVQFSFSKSETSVTTYKMSTSDQKDTSHSQSTYTDTYTSNLQNRQFKHEHSEEKINNFKKTLVEESFSESTLTDTDNLTDESFKSPCSDSKETPALLQNEPINAEKVDRELSDENNSLERRLVKGRCSNATVKNNDALNTTDVVFATGNQNILNDQHKPMLLQDEETTNTTGHKCDNIESEEVEGRENMKDSDANSAETALEELTGVLSETHYDAANTKFQEKLCNKSQVSLPSQSDFEYQPTSSENTVRNLLNQESEAVDVSSAQVECRKGKEAFTEERGDEEAMDIDEVDIYEDLSNQGDHEVVETCEGTEGDIVHDGDPEMNVFEYNQELVHTENTQMIREVTEVSLGNILETKVFDDLSKSSSSSENCMFDHAEDPLSIYECEVREEVFDQHSKNSEQNVNNVVNSQVRSESGEQMEDDANVASEVIEISSSDSESSQNTEDLGAVYKKNACYDNDSGSDDVEEEEEEGSSSSAHSSYTEDYNYDKEQQDGKGQMEQNVEEYNKQIHDATVELISVDGNDVEIMEVILQENGTVDNIDATDRTEIEVVGDVETDIVTTDAEKKTDTTCCSENKDGEDDAEKHKKDDVDVEEKEANVDQEKIVHDKENIALMIENVSEQVEEVSDNLQAESSRSVEPEVDVDEKEVKVHEEVNCTVDVLNNTSISVPYVKLTPMDLVDYGDLCIDSVVGQSTPKKRKSSSRYSLPVTRSRRMSTSSKNESASLMADTTTEGIKRNTERAPEQLETDVPVTRRRTLRTRSVDCDATVIDSKAKKDLAPVNSKRSRTGSLSYLPEIVEEQKGGAKRKLRSKSVNMEEYSVSRRLTRRQADLLHKNFDSRKNSIPKITEEETVPLLEEIDPLQLLDKAPFEGKPDPEEMKVYDDASSIDTGSVCTGRITRRSASVASDTSVTPSELSTPKKRIRSAPKKPSVSPASSSSKVLGVRTRSRAASFDDQTSERSGKGTSLKGKEAEMVKKAAEGVETRSTRSRTKSVSSVTSTDSQKRTTRERRAKSNLPNITEEG